MAWGKIDDKAHSHPKFARAGAEAIGVWAMCLSYCCDYLTDGYVPRDVAVRFAGSDESTERVAARLVGCGGRPGDPGLWEGAEGGWQMHDYLDYNHSRASVLAERESERLRKEASRKKQGRGQDGRITSGQTPNNPRRESARNAAGPLVEARRTPGGGRPESDRTTNGIRMDAVPTTEQPRVRVDSERTIESVRRESTPTAGGLQPESKNVPPVPYPIPEREETQIARGHTQAPSAGTGPVFDGRVGPGSSQVGADARARAGAGATAQDAVPVEGGVCPGGSVGADATAGSQSADHVTRGLAPFDEGATAERARRGWTSAASYGVPGGGADGAPLRAAAAPPHATPDAADIEPTPAAAADEHNDGAARRVANPRPDGGSPAEKTQATKSTTAAQFDFEALYALYPLKGEGRSEGLRLCAAQIRTQRDYDALLAAVKNYAKQKRGAEPRYIKKFNNFMKGEWRDLVGELTRAPKSAEPDLVPETSRYSGWPPGLFDGLLDDANGAGS
jgi:hypothetical protein